MLALEHNPNLGRFALKNYHDESDNKRVKM